MIVCQSSMFHIFLEANFYHYLLTSSTVYESKLRIQCTVQIFITIYKFELIMDVHLSPKWKSMKLLCITVMHNEKYMTVDYSFSHKTIQMKEPRK